MKKSIALLVLISALLFTIPTGEALANGTEDLGPPSITIEAGTDIIVAGKGLSGGVDGLSVPGTITFTVPSGATVKQALLYWEGNLNPSASPPANDTINVDGSSVTGELIGGIDHPTRDVQFVAYRAVITSFVGTGANSLLISGLDFTGSNNGAGVLVIIDDGSGAAVIEIRDGSDRAFIDALAPLDTTKAQTFIFAPEAFARTATLSMFFSDVVGELSTGPPNRPSSITVTVGGTPTTFSNELDSLDGEEWDTVIKPILIPAGASSLIVQAFSRDDGVPGDPATGNLEASFSWITAALSIPPTPPEGCTPGYWKQDQHFDSWEGYLPDDDFEDEDVFGCPITIKWSERGKPQPVTEPTLLEALQAKGGGESALARHAVAALLNADNSDVNYPRNEDQVKTMVCDALSGGDIEETKNTLAGWNEEFCPLDDEKPPSVEHTNGPLRSYDITCQDEESGLAEINVTGSRNFKVDIPPFTAGTNDSIIVTATKTNQSEESSVDLEVIDVAGNVTYYDPEVNSASEEQKSSGGGGGGGCFIATAADG
jgi:hypothetical protein